MNTESQQQIIEESKKLFYDEAAKDKIGFRYRPTYDAALDKAILSAIERSHSITVSEVPFLDGQGLVRPQPDARVEKALQDYDEGKALENLSALAAIDKVVEMVKPYEEEGTWFYRNSGDKAIHELLKTVDLSLLLEHVRKEQKPLVDALVYYRDECSGNEPSLSVFHKMLDDALAKVKQ